MMIDARDEDFELAEINGGWLFLPMHVLIEIRCLLVYTAMMSESQRALVAIQLRWRRLLL